MRIVVRPADDGHDMAQNWEVAGRGKTTAHTRKDAAINEANRRAHKGDTKEIRGTNGQIIRTSTHQGSRGDDGDSNESGQPSGFGVPGLETFETGISDAFK